MPKSQQQALAKSMGVDLNALERQMLSSGSGSEPLESTPVSPRFEDEENEKGKDKEDSYDIEDSENELKPFGYEVFANAPSTFSPVTDIAIPTGYIMGPGDSVSIQMFGKENADLQLTISREGLIVIPNLGPYSVVGLSFSEMKSFLVKRIKEKIIGVDVLISVGKLRSLRVFVLGDAYKPGPYTLSSLSSITHALFAAGGVSDIGSLRNIQLKRAGKLITTFDLYDLLIHGDSSNDILLQSGDVVFIAPVGSRVFVDGEVRRPAIYELTQGDNFENVLNMAGGALPSGYVQSTLVERYSKNNYRTAMDLDLTLAEDLAKEVYAGDFIKVKKSTDLYEKSITLIGALTRPGKYQWYSNRKIADLLPQIDSHLLLHADLNYSLIIREIDRARTIEVLQFSLANAISNPSSKDNLTLMPNDKIVVFSTATKLSEEKLSLDNLAYTQDELFKLERKLAKEKFKAKTFWNKYGNKSAYEEIDEEEALRLQEMNNSIAQITGGIIEEEIDVRELALFSRQRLLAPIIEKLKRQGSAGQPIQLIEVDGEVQFPGVYPLAINGKVKDLVAAAGGVKESAYLARAEITRNQLEGIEIRKISKNIILADALKGREQENILLHSKDRLNIHKIPSWSENHVIELRGEFVFPGKYTIRRGDTLSDIITKAGGLTQFAYAQGSVFSREKLKEIELQNLIKLTSDLRTEMASKSLSDSSSSLSYEDIQSLLNDLGKVEPVGRLVIELPKVIAKNDYDVLLEGGDVLYVPVKHNSVNVIGQVQVTSSHIYDNTLDAEDYISLSGGMKKRADDDRVYIIAANGSIKMLSAGNWFSGNEKVMKPGDTVVVPLDSEYMNNLTLWSTATQIIYNTAVAFAAISGI
jgi:polysaccharide export outer membrane protein